jgi:flagellar motor switch protein FliN/FliY
MNDAMTQTTEAKPDAPNTGSSRQAGSINRKLIDNVGVRLEAFLGEARLTVAELGNLTEESVVPLDATLNRAVELRLNGVPVARGELVAVDDHFGVRLTEISR